MHHRVGVAHAPQETEGTPSRVVVEMVHANKGDPRADVVPVVAQDPQGLVKQLQALDIAIGHDYPDVAFVRAAKLGVRQHHWRFGNMPPVDGIKDQELASIIFYIRELQRANGIN